MYCRKCKNYIDTDSRYCKHCGDRQYAECIIRFPEYDYPKQIYDFNIDKEISLESYRDLEKRIQIDLCSNNPFRVKNGLSNVLFWGYYRTGYRDVRIKRFREKVTNTQLEEFSTLVLSNLVSPIRIRDLGLPEFSGFSFVSKILMFLDSKSYVVLDKKIMQLADTKNDRNPITNIVFRKGKDSGIRINKNSQMYYYNWCLLCKWVSFNCLNSEFAVDAERGFFKLVEEDNSKYGIEKIMEITQNIDYKFNHY